MTDILNRADYEELPPLEKPDGHTRLKYKDGGVLTLSPGRTWEDHVAKQTRPPEKPRDPLAEIDALEARLDKLDGGAVIEAVTRA